MAMVSPLSDAARLIVRRTRFTFAAISLILGVITVAIMVMFRYHHSTKYSLLLIAIVILTIISTLYFNLVADLIFLFPVPCISRDDALISLPGGGGAHYAVSGCLEIAIVPLFLECFIYRHQKVLAPGSRWRLHPLLLHAYTVFYLLCTALFALVIPSRIALQPDGSIHNYAQFLSNSWPHSVLNRADCFSSAMIIVVASVGVTNGVISVAAISAISTHTFISIRKSSTLSARLRSYHRSMTRALLMQSGVPILVLGYPLIVGNAVILFQWNNACIVPN